MISSRDFARILLVSFVLLVAAARVPLYGQRPLMLTKPEESISQQLHKLRGMSDQERSESTRMLALKIRKLPVTLGKVRLANGLASLSTEGDFGHDTLQEVTNTLSAAIQEYEQTGKPDGLPYQEVAQLARYEGVQTSLNNPKYLAAMAELEAADRRRAEADFTLTDLQGHKWSLKELRGRVVVINFWATWCPPCRKELADLEALYESFKGQGLIVLGISDEDADKLRNFTAAQKITYPVLPDTDGKIHKMFSVEGIPRSVVYDRDGKLAAQAIDMRTRQQFLLLLNKAGLK